MAAAIASAMPVLPDVASISVSPGRMSPRSSARRIIDSAGLSLTDPAGLLPSSLPRTTLPRAALSLAPIGGFTNSSPGGEIGRRRGLKTPRRKACRFDSGPGHHSFLAILFAACSAFVRRDVPQMTNKGLPASASGSFLFGLLDGDACPHPQQVAPDLAV